MHGYCPEMVAIRRRTYKERDDIINFALEYHSQITTGSKGEGFSKFHESDTDMLFIDKYRGCVYPNELKSLPDNLSVFTMHNDHCDPGYVRLKRQKCIVSNAVDNFLSVTENGELFVLRDLYKNFLAQVYFTDKDRDIDSTAPSGPSAPGTRGLYKEDRVWSFRCFSQKQILKSWIQRKRKYGWPSLSLIEEVSSIEAQLVPVGCKGSKHKDLEWRICFVPGEIKLSQSLNETQYKLYILLKLIKESIIRPICKDVSSYILKNIVFWLIENKPSDMFVPENLLKLTVAALENLYDGLRSRFVPYYMISDRNLLTGIVTDEEQNLLLTKLEQLISCGPTRNLLTNCKLNSCILDSVKKRELLIVSSKRDLLETARLRQISIRAKHFNPNVSYDETECRCWNDPEFRKVCYESNDIAWPEWKQFLFINMTENGFGLATEIEQKWINEFKRKKRGKKLADVVQQKIDVVAIELEFDKDQLSLERLIDVLNVVVVKTELALS